MEKSKREIRIENILIFILVCYNKNTYGRTYERRYEIKKIKI
jgi:hypothetical protein